MSSLPHIYQENYKFLLVMVSIKRVLFFFKPLKTGTFSGVSSLFKKWAFDFVSRKYVKNKKSRKKEKEKECTDFSLSMTGNRNGSNLFNH